MTCSAQRMTRSAQRLPDTTAVDQTEADQTEAASASMASL